MWFSGSSRVCHAWRPLETAVTVNTKGEIYQISMQYKIFLWWFLYLNHIGSSYIIIYNLS
jgi:hypothetical protein